MLRGMDGPAAEGRVIVPVSVIEPIITCHLEISFWDMLNQELYEVDSWDSLLHKGLVLMPVVMECVVSTVIGVNAGKGA